MTFAGEMTVPKNWGNLDFYSVVFCDRDIRILSIFWVGYLEFLRIRFLLDSMELPWQGCDLSKISEYQHRISSHPFQLEKLPSWELIDCQNIFVLKNPAEWGRGLGYGSEIQFRSGTFLSAIPGLRITCNLCLNSTGASFCSFFRILFPDFHTEWNLDEEE